MQKPRPGGGEVLRVSGAYAAFRSFDMARYGEPVYRLGSDLPLDGVLWADWSADGLLLVATLDGRLRVCDGESTQWEQDLSALAPDPQPPPPEAARWEH